MGAVLDNLIEVLGGKAKVKSGEGAQTYLKRLSKAIDGLDDDKWKSLDDDTQKWHNGNTKNLDDGDELDNFPDIDDGEDDDATDEVETDDDGDEETELDEGFEEEDDDDDDDDDEPAKKKGAKVSTVKAVKRKVSKKVTKAKATKQEEDSTDEEQAPSKRRVKKQSGDTTKKAGGGGRGFNKTGAVYRVQKMVIDAYKRGGKLPTSSAIYDKLTEEGISISRPTCQTSANGAARMLKILEDLGMLKAGK